jgi:peptide/nickel transport system ATP-binding protein
VSTLARGPLVLQADSIGKDFRLAGRVTLAAVGEVSLDLHRRTVVALVGESGSGKSTVARLLAGQERPSRGRILLDGNEIEPRRRGTFRTYKRHVQMVFQDPFASLNPAHTVRYHLERPLRLHRRIDGAELDRELERALDRVRLVPAKRFLGKYPHQLSGGQRQRVAIARALAVGPRVLLADEPVSMLDVSIRLEILDLLDELRSELELAILYITHDIASARYFADEILVMYAGEIVERGPAEELTQAPAHPYTQLLVSSAPDPDNLRGHLAPHRRLANRITAVEDAVRTGRCSFSTRCPFAGERCHNEVPSLTPIDADRTAACWRLDIAAPELLAATREGVRR